jgi:FkbM family methyltransferase
MGKGEVIHLMDRHAAAISSLLEPGCFPKDAFHIDKAFAGRRLIIYGAGECSHWFFEIVMKMYGCTPVAVVDRAFGSVSSFEGIPAFSPDNYHPSEEDRRDAIVIICVGNRKIHAEIQGYLKGLGFQNIIFLLDVYEVHNPFKQPPELTVKGFDYYLERREQILHCLDLFQDEWSRDVYVGCLRTHLTRKPVLLPESPRKEQYFPKDVPLSSGYSRFINCGAYDGDIIRLLNEVHGKVDEIVCFEPEPRIFKRLVEYLDANLGKLADRVISLPCAVYGREDLVRFVSSSGLGSRISEAGDSFVKSVALDHILHGFKPTFICMDAEGAEPEILRGAERLIRENRPDMGICVYHSPSHLWELPLYLDSLGLGYRFHLRNYTGFYGETVLYASV